MAEQDIIERILTSSLAFVADFLNFVLFGGKNVVKASDLELKREELPYKKPNGKRRELRRDSFFVWRKGKLRFCFIGIESQTQIDRDMALRLAAYDGLSYYDQLKNPKGKRYPVITFVLYYGEKPWTKYLLLSERFNLPKKFREQIAPYFNDYKVNVIDIRRLTLKDIRKFRSVFKYIATYFYSKDHPEEHVTLPRNADITQIAEFAKAFFNSDDVWVSQEELEKGELTMEDLVTRYRKQEQREVVEAAREEGIEIGVERGIVKGREEGRAEGIGLGAEKEKQATALRLAKKGFSLDQIVELVDSEPVVVDSWLAELE